MLGPPVVEMLRGAGLGCEITAVTITGGERERRGGGPWASVPKRDLLAGVQVALGNGKIPDCGRRLKELGSLVRELVDVRMIVELWSGKVRIGADGYGEHDDLVIPAPPPPPQPPPPAPAPPPPPRAGAGLLEGRSGGRTGLGCSGCCEFWLVGDSALVGIGSGNPGFGAVSGDEHGSRRIRADTDYCEREPLS